MPFQPLSDGRFSVRAKMDRRTSNAATNKAGPRIIQTDGSGGSFDIRVSPPATILPSSHNERHGGEYCEHHVVNRSRHMVSCDEILSDGNAPKFEHKLEFRYEKGGENAAAASTVARLISPQHFGSTLAWIMPQNRHCFCPAASPTLSEKKNTDAKTSNEIGATRPSEPRHPSSARRFVRTSPRFSPGTREGNSAVWRLRSIRQSGSAHQSDSLE
jgi:hypothetical protein